ncbi:uncharacterized protein ASPGLDRAFT_27897 [Aspergillus glaucus CBS 516.65]|uniref:Biogenesis of lysosome-related organelles complex 1 subunit 1 n=1 Tax=Aspergillus glaucus CBS 516.65 TaxID=1160497 RepID=A0A1L9VC59_ASPGL|nr:hypothetical protein ASPGLDRAFT_27897 [Aspergillus glaucus CBS 516.65]OJJ81510.1 hypothetical protein ASPGLDRAFT_27897 [Aspergillus glaucus CBS 516.65]
MSSQTQPHPNHPTQDPSEEDQTRRTTEAKTAFTASLSSIGNNHDAPLRARASLLHANATALSKQETDVARATEDLGRSNGELEGAADKAREGLKEIGDVQNWAEVIERELLVLEEVVRGVEEKIEEQEGGVDGDDRGGEQRGDDGVGRRGDGNGSGNGEGSGWLKWW